MEADALAFGGTQDCCAIPDAGRDGDAAEVVNEACAAHRLDLMQRQRTKARAFGGEVGDAARVAMEPGRLEVDEVGEHGDHGIEVGVGHEVWWAGFRKEDGVPYGWCVEWREDVGGVLAQCVDDFWIEGVAGSSPRHLEAGVLTAKSIEQLRVPRDVHDARGEWD
jgi:hypothetical protein